jgi:hypothetical protein
MADLYTQAIGGSTVGANTRKTLGDGAAGIGPYTRFSNPALTAIQVVSGTLNFTTTPTITNSLYSKLVTGLQAAGVEIFYAGKPHASTQGAIFLVNSSTLPRGGRGASAYGGTDDTGETTYENIEEIVADALGVAGSDITVAELVLTGTTFA